MRTWTVWALPALLILVFPRVAESQSNPTVVVEPERDPAAAAPRPVPVQPAPRAVPAKPSPVQEPLKQLPKLDIILKPLYKAAPKHSPVFESLWVDAPDLDLAELVVLARSSNPYERQYAVLRLGELADENRRALDVVVHGLDDHVDGVSDMAVASLMRLGRIGHPVLIGQLDNQARRIRDLAFAVLHHADDLSLAELTTYYQRIGGDEEMLRKEKELSAQMSRSYHDTVRLRGRNGSFCRETEAGAVFDRFSADFFLRGLGRQSGWTVVTRSAAERALLLIAKAEPRPATALLPLLSSPSLAARAAALCSLVEASEVPVSMVPPLSSIVDSGEPLLVPLALEALGLVPGKRAASERLRALGSQHPGARVAAVSSLPADAPGFADKISTALGDRDRDVRFAAVGRLAGPLMSHWDDAPPCEQLQADLASGYEQMSTQIFQQMLAVGLDWAPSWGPRESRLEDSERELLEWTIIEVAVLRLCCGRPDFAQPAIDALLHALSTADRQRQAQALELLGKLGQLGYRVEIGKILPRVVPLMVDDSGSGNPLSREADRVLAEATAGDASGRLLIEAYLRLQRASPRRGQNFLDQLTKNPPLARLIYPELLSLVSRRGSLDVHEARVLSTGRPPGSVPSVARRALVSLSTADRLKLLIHLVDQGWNPAFDMLKELLMSEKLELRQRQPGFEALLRAGAPGIDHLFALAGRADISAEVWEQTIQHLVDMPVSDPRLGALFLQAAGNPNLVPVILDTPWLLDFVETEPVSLNPMPHELEKRLREGLKSQDPYICSNALRVWAAFSRTPPPEAEELLRHGSPWVRSRALTQLATTSAPNPRLGPAVRRALDDPDNDVRANAAEVAGQSGELGASLLNEKLSSTADPGWRARLLQASGYAAPGHKPLQATLLRIAAGGEENDRRLAATALLRSEFDPWQHDGLLVQVLVEMEVRERMTKLAEDVGPVLYARLTSRQMVSNSESPGTNPGMGWAVLRELPLPRFPWPPPGNYKKVRLDRALLGSEANTLGEVYSKLEKALEAASEEFEYQLFKGVPRGFAVVARMERIRVDGTPYPGRARWLQEGTPTLSLLDFLSNVFFEKPGYFRVIAFIVTDDPDFQPSSSAELPTIQPDTDSMPREMRALELSPEHELLALVYTFERKRKAKIAPWPARGLPPKMQLRRAGLETLAPSPQ